MIRTATRRIRLLALSLGFLLVASASHGHSQASAQDDKPTIVAELESLVMTRLPSKEWPERNRKIAAWLDKVQKEQIDLKEHAYLTAVAHYFARDYETAGKELIAYLDAHAGKIPNPAMSKIVGRVALNHAVQLVREGDSKRFLPVAEHCLGLYEPRATIYRALCYQLKRNEKMRPMLHEMLRRALSDPSLDTEARESLLTTLYTPRPTRGGGVDRGEAMRKAWKGFDGVTLDGKQVSAADYQGKVLLVDFWATWCGPCLREMPNVVRAYDKLQDEGFAVIGISLDQEKEQKRGGKILPPTPETIAKIREVMKKHDMTWPCIYEGGGWGTRLAKKNGIRSIPATFLFDRQGKLRHTDLRGPALERAVRALLAEK